MNKPPLIDVEAMDLDFISPSDPREARIEYTRHIAQAQRDADLKWLCEEVEKRPNRYLIVDGTGTKYFTGPHIDAQIEAYESCRQDFLALLRGDSKEVQ